MLVQPSFYGTDNSAMLAAMKAAGPSFRGVAVIGDDATPRDLEAMHAAGIRGARLNIVDLREGKGRLPVERIQRLAQRIAPFGWHIEFLMHVDEFPDLDRMLDGLPVDVVFGHLGYVRADKGTGVAGFQALLRLLRGGRAWVKFTGPYRISSQLLPHADTVAFAHALLATAPDRIVWGSDWPHVMTRWTIPMPNDGALADLLLDWIPDARQRDARARRQSGGALRLDVDGQAADDRVSAQRRSRSPHSRDGGRLDLGEQTHFAGLAVGILVLPEILLGQEN